MYLRFEFFELVEKRFAEYNGGIEGSREPEGYWDELPSI